MSEISRPNFPDILGEITGQQRLQFDVVEAALTLKPAAPRSGETFDAILLLQNTVEDSVEVIATPRLPAHDTKGKKGCFTTQAENMKIALAPGAVGFLSLPILVAPLAAPGSDYKLSIDISVSYNGKPNQIRDTSEPANPDYHSFIKEETLPKIEALKKLKFPVQKSSVLHRGIEATFHILPGSKPTEAEPTKPGWYRLWTLADNTDLRLLMERYETVLRNQILPTLTRQNLYEVLYQATARRFAGHDYLLQPDEVHYITKLMVHVLELAHEPSPSIGYPGQEVYQVGETLKHRWLNRDAPLLLPRWCRAMLLRIDAGSQIAAHPVIALATALYDDLLQDAVVHGFELINQEIGYRLGSPDDSIAYARRLVKTLNDKKASFTSDDIYLPLILGGIIVDSTVVLSQEKPQDRLANITEHIRQQRPPGGTQTQRILIHSVCSKVCNTALQQYSSWT